MIPKKPDTAAIGIGMSVAKPEALVTLIKTAKKQRYKIVIGCFSFDFPAVLKEISGTNTIITPHAGEYKRIFGGDNSGISEKEQISNVQRLVKHYGITIILKGQVNVVSDGNDRHVAVIKMITRTITVQETGDVLSGLAAGIKFKTVHLIFIKNKF